MNGIRTILYSLSSVNSIKTYFSLSESIFISMKGEMFS